MSKIAFYYSAKDWCNGAIVAHLRAMGHSVDELDIADTVVDLTASSAYRHDLYINRVYPSSTYDHTFNHLRLSLELTRHLEASGRKVVNSFMVTFMDYSKSEAANRMRELGTPVPDSYLVAEQVAARKLGEDMEFPKIVKMDTGGRALNVYKVLDKREYNEVVDNLARDHHLIHIEDFHEPPGYVARIFVLDYKFQVAYKRLVNDGEWLASHSQGSEVVLYDDVPGELTELAERTAKGLECPIVGFDVVETGKGPFFVDVNPTPVFSEEYIELFGFDPTERIARYLSSRV